MLRVEIFEDPIDFDFPEPVDMDSDQVNVDYKIEYHPNSIRDKHTETFSLEEYLSRNPKSDSPADSTPWSPFRSRLDFEVAELILDAHMNQSQTNILLNLIHRCIRDQKSFTLSNFKDLSSIWDEARKMHMSQVRRHDVLL